MIFVTEWLTHIATLTDCGESIRILEGDKDTEMYWNSILSFQKGKESWKIIV